MAGKYDLRGKRVDWKPPGADPNPPEAQEGPSLDQRIQLLKRQKKAIEARDKLIPFVEFTMPSPESPNDSDASAYFAAKHHRAIARVLEEFESGNIPRLILTAPPRHGKSELSTRRFPSWYSGRNPRHNVAVASYSDTMAEDFGADVRSIISSPAYRQVFPKHRLRKGGGAKSRIQTAEGGLLVFVGRGGALTGRGAHCFTSGTSVLTADGERQIQTLRPGDEVLSIENGRFVRRPVQAISHRSGARIFRVTTAAGRVVEVTADHPFYVEGAWIEAGELAAGDRLLCAVRRDDGSASVRDSEAFPARPRAFLLLDRVLGACHQREAARGADVWPLRGAGAPAVECRVGGTRTDLLLARLLGSRAARGVRAAGARAHEALRTMQRHVHARQPKYPLLFDGLCFAGARGPDARGRESSLEEWRDSKSGEAPRHPAVSRNAASRDATRRPSVRALRALGGVGGPPYRRESAEQPSGEPRDSVPAVSSESSLFRREGDVVVSVEDTGRTADVYDLQVGGTHCFFANGILVHNCLLIDDPFKDAEEASSQAIRDQAWNWFTRVAMTRLMGKKLVCITLTRWHEDDIVGRLIDPTNPHYNAVEASKWKIINFPAIAEDDDPLGRAPGEPLWPDGPDKFDLDFLEGQRRLDPLGFAALYQQRPTVEDGIMFRREHVQYYTPEQLPADLRIYAASDHAVGTDRAKHDATVLLTAGVDRQGNIYLLDCFWERAATDKVVEAMLTTAKLRKPLVWWAERGHISKSIGPFLKKRMLEAGVYFNVVEVTPAANKEQRAQSIAARMAMGMVYWPKHAAWAQKAVDELLKFPHGRNDDFVDAIAYIGLGLQNIIKADVPKPQDQAPKYGTLAWVKDRTRQRERRERLAYAGGW